MKYLIVVAAIFAIASSQEFIIDQLQEKLSQMTTLPAEKVAELKEIITKTAKDCLVKAADGVTPEKSKAAIDFAMPAVLGCKEKLKDVPLDQTERRQTMLIACLTGKVATSGLDDTQLALFKKMKACFKAAKPSKAPQ